MQGGFSQILKDNFPVNFEDLQMITNTPNIYTRLRTLLDTNPS
eukprot:UN08809